VRQRVVRARARAARRTGIEAAGIGQSADQLQRIERRHLAAVELGERVSTSDSATPPCACRQAMAAASISDQTLAVAPDRETRIASSSKPGLPPARRSRSSSVFR
jgi:hypothetical protein